MRAWGMYGEMLERSNSISSWIFPRFFSIIIIIGAITDLKKESRYLVVRLFYDRNKGETMSGRISYLNKIVKHRFDAELFSIYRKVKYYCSYKKSNIEKEIPLLFEYAFLSPGRSFSYEDFKEFVKNDRLGISLLGGVQNGEAEWVDQSLSDQNVMDLTDLGTNIKIGDFIRVVSGPFRGYMGTLIGWGRERSYVIDVKGVRLSVSSNYIRGLEYDAREETISLM